MNWKIEHIERENFVNVTASDCFSAADHKKKVEDVVSKEFWKPGMNVLFDERKVEFKDTDIELVKEVSNSFKSFDKQLGSGKVAVLMNSLIDYARGRQFELLTAKSVSAKIKIFTDETQAVDWLKS